MDRMDRTTRVNLFSLVGLGLLGLAVIVFSLLEGLSESLVLGLVVAVVGFGGAAYRWTASRSSRS
jgi:hypothetical protein